MCHHSLDVLISSILAYAADEQGPATDKVWGTSDCFGLVDQRTHKVLVDGARQPYQAWYLSSGTG